MLMDIPGPPVFEKWHLMLMYLIANFERALSESKRVEEGKQRERERERERQRETERDRERESS